MIKCPQCGQVMRKYYSDKGERLFYCSKHGTFCSYTLRKLEPVYLDGIYPYCREHGAMNKVSKYGMWRCLMCHVGYDETMGKVLKDSTEGFRKH